VAKSIEIGQLGSYLTVDDNTQVVSIGSDIKLGANSGIVTALSFDGTATRATIADGLDPNASLNAGIASITHLNSNVVDCNTTIEKSLLYDASSSSDTINVSYSTDPAVIIVTNSIEEELTLNVSNIPTSGFDNRVLNYTVVCINSGFARSCRYVKFNNVNMPIKWFGGRYEYAIAGLSTITGYDIYNFVGINTVGTVDNMSNFDVIGILNGYFH
jgi:hypothetical protein